MADADDAVTGNHGDAMAEVVGRMVKRLRQHCDAVQIVAVKYDEADDQTYTVTDGSGNWQARYGAMKRWVVRADENERDDVRRANRESDD